MARANTHNERVWVYRLETDNGLVSITDGHGASDTAGLVGKDPWTIMWDDDIGFGPQIAAFDLCGKDGRGARARPAGQQAAGTVAPFRGGTSDMAPEDWVKEAEESLRRGYTSFKMKARPWRDIIAQIDAVSEVVPARLPVRRGLQRFPPHPGEGGTDSVSARPAGERGHVRKSFLPAERPQGRTDAPGTHPEAHRGTLRRRRLADGGQRRVRDRRWAPRVRCGRGSWRPR